MKRRMEIGKVVNFLFELMHLKRVGRSGWICIGVKEPDSVAEHSFAAAQIAYILGKMERVNAERSALIALFHDNGEARVFDINMLQGLYLRDKEEAESQAFLAQVRDLPGEKEIEEFYQEFRDQETKEAIVARDADFVEMAFQAKCYKDLGYPDAQMWIDHAKASVKTKSAKELIDEVERTEMTKWWKEVPGIRERMEEFWRKIGRINPYRF